MNDVGAAIFSASLVTPLISIIDRAIFNNASGTPMVASISRDVAGLFKNPVVFLKQPSVLFILGVYSSTYIAANLTQSWCLKSGQSWQFPTFVASSSTNVILSVVKDNYYTRTFGTGVAKSVAKSSLSLYGLRDSMSVFASFNLPPILAATVLKDYDPKWSLFFAQLITPCAMQFINTPLHLLGMDIYNRQDASIANRMSFIKKEYLKTTLARIGEI